MEPRKFSLLIWNSRLCKELGELPLPEMRKHRKKNQKSVAPFLQFGGRRETERNTDADFSETKISLFNFGNVKDPTNLWRERTKFQVIAAGWNPVICIWLKLVVLD